MASASDASKELTLLRELVSTLQQENALLRQKVEALIRRVFGASSERIDSAQLELLLQLAGGTAVPTPEAPRLELTAAPAPRSSPPRAQRLPDNLPVVEEVIDPAPVKTQPEQWRCIGQEVSEQLDYEPARFLRRRLVRRKYVHMTDLDRAPIIAPLPEKLQERGVAGPGLLAQVVVSKYCDNLPLYRQELIFAQRHKINLPRQTLARWMELCADWLQPIYEHIRTGVLAGGDVQADETPIDISSARKRTNQTRLPLDLQPAGRRRLLPLGNQSRGGVPGEPAGSTVPRRGAERRLQCLSRVRRTEQKYKTLGLLGARAAQVPRGPRTNARKSRLGAAANPTPLPVESLLREKKAGPALRQAVRSHQSRPLLARLRQTLLHFKSSRRHLPQSLLGQAIDYALGQWSTLQFYLEDGRLEIDNNLVENAIRPTALGKKNWLCVGEAGAGRRSAILYTIVASRRRRKIDPYVYLREVPELLPRLTNQQNRRGHSPSVGQRPASQSTNARLINVRA
jgi:transposase